MSNRRGSASVSAAVAQYFPRRSAAVRQSVWNIVVLHSASLAPTGTASPDSTAVSQYSPRRRSAARAHPPARVP